MDACIQAIFAALALHGILDETLIVLTGDHGETLYDHECWFDHHGLYDVTLHVPAIILYPGHFSAGKRLAGFDQHKDMVPTLMELAGIDFDGRSLLPIIDGTVASYESEFYITESSPLNRVDICRPACKRVGHAKQKQGVEQNSCSSPVSPNKALLACWGPFANLKRRSHSFSQEVNVCWSEVL